MLPVQIVAQIIVTGDNLAVQVQERIGRQVGIAARTWPDISQAVLADAANAESGLRGYAATRDPRFLAPYTATPAPLPDDLALTAAASTGFQRSGVGRIAVAVHTEFTDLPQPWSSVLAGTTPAELASALQAGKVRMDQLRVQISNMQIEPLRKSAEKRAEITRLENTARTIEIIGASLGVLAGPARASLVSRRIRLAADNADRLGQGQELLTTPSSKREYGSLGHSLTVARQLLATRLG